MTVWCSVNGWDGYEVSDAGQVRRTFVANNGHRPTVLRGSVANTGYLVVALGRDKKKSGPLLVHRLVCEAFHGPAPDADAQVAHGDGNKLNNAASNLRWATAAENAADRRLHGLDTIGERHGMVKICEADVAAIISACEAGERQRDTAKRFGIHQAQVHRIYRRKSWRHLELR